MPSHQHGEEHDFNDPKVAIEYAKHVKKWNKRTGPELAKVLTEKGFKGGLILDAGCGAGVVASEIASRIPKAKVVGIDLSPAMIDISRKSAKEYGVEKRTQFRQADAQDLPFKDDEFDAVISMAMLHEVPDPVKYLREMDRVLKPNGILIVRDLKKSGLGVFMHFLRDAYKFEAAREIVAKARIRQVKESKKMVLTYQFVF